MFALVMPVFVGATTTTDNRVCAKKINVVLENRETDVRTTYDTYCDLPQGWVADYRLISFERVTNSDNSSSNSIDKACTRAAVSKKEGDMIGGWSAFHSSLLSAMTTKKNSLLSAWDKDTAKERRTARKAAFDAFKNATKNAKETYREVKKDAKATFKTEMKACKASGEAGETDPADGALGL